MSFHSHKLQTRPGSSQPKALTISLAAVGMLILSHTKIHAQGIPATITVNSKVSTSAVKGDADDPAIWIHPTDPAKSVIIGTDPARGDNNQIVAFATGDGISGDREGLGIYKCAGGTGYLVASSQGNSTVKIYRREGEAGDPNKHTLITTIQTNGSSQTDGLDITNLPTSTTFPKGFLVKHNSPGKQFVLYAWEDIAQTYLSICPEGKPSAVDGESAGAMPDAFNLQQNYPNPFLSGAKSPLAENSSTTIPFHLEKAASVKLTVINLMGQTVRTLAAGQMAAGDYSTTWDGRNEAGEIVPSGTYLIQLQNGNRTQIKRLMLIK